ncbi:MAG: FKBP-type peptidyl-prolyl cis-trans isomerase SlyD [Parasphingorhabdus sp.]|jgi:FKBP-type peptidyl-prolyl cis-trans isomerase SlyD
MTEQTIQKDKLVTINYSILDNMGQVMEQSELPVSYLHGHEFELFPQVLTALEGLKPGQKVSVELKPEEAFGPHNPDLTFTDDVQNSPKEARYIGAELEAKSDTGEVRRFRVTRIEEGRITADANHPLAGKTITYEINITDVRDPNPEELPIKVLH